MEEKRTGVACAFLFQYSVCLIPWFTSCLYGYSPFAETFFLSVNAQNVFHKIVPPKIKVFVSARGFGLVLVRSFQSAPFAKHREWTPQNPDRNSAPAQGRYFLLQPALPYTWLADFLNPSPLGCALKYQAGSDMGAADFQKR